MPLFGSGFVDEIFLKEKSNELLDKFHGVLTAKRLHQVTREQGIDTATALLYEWITQQQHCDFYQYISSLPTNVDTSACDSKVIIIPGMFHKEYPEMGGNGSIIKSIAERFNFEVETIPCHSTGDIRSNASILHRHIQHADSPVWLISISKGSAETGYCLNQLDTAQKKKITGWISLCGIFNGSPIADIRLKNPLNKLILKSYLRVKGAKFEAIEEMRPSNPLWTNDLCSFDGLQIHVHPIPVAAYVHAKLIKRYRQLAPMGPNDGTILLDDLIDRPGHIYPLWGVDHFFRDRSVVPLVYKLCRFIKNFDNQRKSNDENITQKHHNNSAVPVISL